MARFPPLAQIPLAGLDPAFEESVRSAPRPEQDRLLAEADLLRIEEDDASSWRALTVYRALAERLAEGGPIQLDRAAWSCREDPARDAVQARIATLALQHPGENEQVDAACTLAVCEWLAGNFTAAERRLKELLPRVRGREDRHELQVYYGLASLYSWQHRELESLVLARRAQQLADRHPELHPVQHAHASSVLADAYRSLGDAEGLTRAAQRMLAISTRMSEPDAGRLRRQAHTSAHEAAMLRGDLPGARDHLAAAQLEQSRDLKTAGHTDRILPYYEARLALRLGDLERAALLVEGHREHAQGHSTAWLMWRMLDIEVSLRNGRRAQGCEMVAQSLERIAEPGMRAHLGTGRRLRNAERLGELLEDLDGEARLTALAYREAADAAYDRLRELERTLSELPELAEITEEDRETLARYRARFAGRHRVVLEHLREILVAARARGELPAWATAAPGGMTAVCAWCRSVRGADGRWLPLGHFVTTSGPDLTVTHGICEDCRSSVRKSEAP